MKSSRSYSLVCLVAVSLLSIVSSYAQEKHLPDTVKSKEGLRSNGGLGPMPYHYISSQDNIVMPAPDVAKMTRYADTPVSYAIGLPEISIPIHTIQSRSLNLPITLTYDASGIKPGEISGIAGLGWSFQAGGVITREIIGRKDDNTNDIPSETTNPNDAYFLSYYVRDSNNSDYDCYHYSFCGHSGSFYYLPDASGVKQIVPTEPTELIISNTNGGFEIIDTEGTRYLFTLAESSSRTLGSTDPNAPLVDNTVSYDIFTVTSWHLTDIWSMDGTDHITIHYHQIPSFSHHSYSYYRSVSFPYRYLGSDQYETNFNGGFDPTPTFQTKEWSTRAISSWTPFVPDTLSFNGGRVVISYNPSGVSGHLGSHRSYPVFLDSVELKDALDNIIGSWAFSKYITGDQRTLLTSVVQRGTDGSLIERWDLDYLSKNTNMYEDSIDLFGYFNSSCQKAFLRPFNDEYTIPFSGSSRMYYQGDAGKLSLTSITTASGSKTYFDFEPNAIATNGQSDLFPQSIEIGQRISCIRTYDLSGGSEKLIRQRKFTYSGPDITIPVYGFQSAAFISTSESNYFDGGTLVGYWYGPWSPVRTCSIVYSDQSNIPGMSLESARIFYHAVIEDVSESTPVKIRTRWEYDAGGAVSDGAGGTVWTPSDAHDNQYTNTSLNRNHFSHRVPSRIPRNGSQSNLIVPLGYYFMDQNRPQLSHPTRVTTYKMDLQTLQFVPVSITEYTYEYADTLVQTGYRVDCKRSLNNNDLYEDPDYCLEDFDQQQIDRKIIHLRLKQRLDIEYLDDRTIKQKVTQYGYAFSRNARSSFYSGGSYSLGAVHVPQMGEILSPRYEMTVYLDSAPKAYVRSVVYPDELVGVSGCSWASLLLNKGYRSPVAEELTVGILGVTLLSRAGRYTTWGNVPVSTWADGNTNRALLKPYRIDTYRNGVNVGPTILLSKYDTLGRSLEVQVDGQPVKTYAWGYNHRFPVAEIAGEPFAQLQSSLSGADRARLDAISDAQILCFPSDSTFLRDIFQNHLPQAQTTLYTYSPPFGISSMKDPSGRRTDYTYDFAGRLTSVKDENGNKVMGYSYDLTQGGNGCPNRIETLAYTEPGSMIGTAVKEVSYYDGLGRKAQNISVGAATGNQDLVTPISLNFLDYDFRVNLPYPAETNISDSGSFRNDALTAQQTYYGNGVKAYTANMYEISSRKKIISTSLPGFTETTSFATSGAAENTVLKLSYNASANTVSASGYYPDGTFTVTRTIGPDGSRTESYADEIDTPVLERVLLDESGTYADTYYIKDAIGRVICVIPPAEAAQLTSSTTGYSAVNCYTYAYDGRDRVTKRQLPAVAPETITYNDADLPLTRTRLAADGISTEVFTTDYDVFNRPMRERYTYGNNPAVTLAEYHYDDYPSWSPNFSTESGFVTASDKDTRTHGLRTAERIRVLPGSASPSTLFSSDSTASVNRTFYYDGKGNVIQTIETDGAGKTLRSSSKYGFSGNVLKERQRVSPGSAQTEHILDKNYTYDARLRPASVTAQLDGGSIASQGYLYDYMERIDSVFRGTGIENTKYNYSLQGWLLSANSTSWEETLRYASPSLPATSALPGKIGLITEWTSQQKGGSSDGAATAETQAFSYDKAGRLLGSLKYIGTATTGTNAFTEQDITYDRSGNLLTLDRYGGGDSTPSDVLSFSYSGPKRNGWTYDTHGNVLVDPLNGVSLEWNVRDLPRSLAAGDSATHRTYLADGTLKQISDGTASRIYLGDMVFDQSSGTISLESASWEGGRLLPGTGNDKILYQVTDHLGSVRVVKDGAGGNLQRFDYYPFGSFMRSWSSSTDPAQATLRYRFSGKEVAGQSIVASPVTSAIAGTPAASAGTPYLDFGARLYDPRSAAWLSQDPMAEKYYGISPYSYCTGNPVNLVDPNGSIIGDYYNLSGNYIGTDGLDDRKKYLVLDYSEVKIIKKTNKAGGITPTSKVKTAVSVPSDAVVTMMEEAYVVTEDNGLEHGFRTSRNYITQMAEGTDKNVYMTGPENELKERGEYATLEVHTHPKGSLESFGDAEPSKEDKTGAFTTALNVVLGYKAISEGFAPNTIGQKETYSLVRHICYFNKDGVIGQAVRFETYKSAVNKINKSASR